MKPLTLKKTERGDFLLLVFVVLLSLIGTLFIYSASRYSAENTYNDSLFFVKKQVIGIILGVITMIFACNYDYNKLKKFNIPVAIISVILLALVFVPNIGIENYGAKRWISFAGVSLQPSEIAKFSLILFCATAISKNPDKQTGFKGFIPLLLFGGLICFLIITEPNMSITICCVLLLFTLIFASGIKIRYLLILVVPAFVFGVILILIEPYRLKRLLAFINPWSSPKGEGYQLLQSLYALGSGGMFGVGLFNSRQKYNFLPFAESDFILSIIGEEIGFFGILLFFSLLLFIVIRGLIIASRSKNVFGFILAIGITLIFGIQVIINALVVSGSIPPTGLPLPLVSSGNTSIIIFMTEMGILYNVSKQGTITF